MGGPSHSSATAMRCSTLCMHAEVQHPCWSEWYMHACVFTVDISNSTLPQFFTVLYAVFVYYYSCSLCCTLWLCTVAM